MSEHNNSRSGTQTAATLVRAAKAAYRIIQAAAVSGAYGAAVVAAKEALPFLKMVLPLAGTPCRYYRRRYDYGSGTPANQEKPLLYGAQP